MSVFKHIQKSIRTAIWTVAGYFHLSENAILVLLAVVVGLAGGFGAIGFRALIDGLQSLTAGGSGASLLESLASLPWYYLLLLPAAGGLVVGPLVHFLAPEARGHGVPEVMEAVALHGGRIRPRVVGVKSLASALTITTGGSVGREGPIVQIGSAIGSSLGQFLELRHDRMRVLVGCGAAAGIAATFNAPVAGVLFAIELILGSYAITTLTPLIISSVVATVVCHAFPGITGGDVRAFEIDFVFSLVSAWELPMYFALGIAAALVAWFFMKTLFFSESLFAAVPIPPWLKAPVGGLALGSMILLSSRAFGGAHIFGIGYESIEMAMGGGIVWWGLLGLIGLKILATSVTLGSGGSGGIFAPSLFLGAMAGGAFGIGVHALFPAVTAHPGAYALVGMGAVVAGTTHAPITAIIILFELTGDYEIILPIMIACVLANLITSRISRDSIYTEKLRRRGVKLRQGLDYSIIESSKVSGIILENPPTVAADENINHVLHHFLDSHVMEVYVLDDDGGLMGVIHLNNVIGLIRESGVGDTFIAADVMERDFPTVLPESTLSEVFRKFGTCHLDELPVVEDTSDGPGKLLGTITRRAVFVHYNREILRQNALGLKFVYEGADEDSRMSLGLPKDNEVKVLHVPEAMVGRTLKELDIRARFNVSILAVRSHRYDPTTDSDIPSPDRVLKRNETLILVGRHRDIETLMKWDGSS
jgi:CIC family chloride channel protein